jgi:hypothetical protein
VVVQLDVMRSGVTTTRRAPRALMRHPYAATIGSHTLRVNGGRDVT